MTPSARIASAIEILAQIDSQRRPAQEAMKEWGVAHRFAGSKDRAAISALVHDALRVKASASWIMGSAEPRAIMLGALKMARGLDVEAISQLFNASAHSPDVLTPDEISHLETDNLASAPDHVRGDYPEWLAASFAAAFGDHAIDEGRALSLRAPVDLRVNISRTSRDNALKSISHLLPEETDLSPIGLRLQIGADGRGPALLAEPAYAKGLIEVQDEGSQLAALLAAAQPGMQVLDLCAGAGGKTLALAAGMDQKGQIYATDIDGRRLMPIYPRLERAGVRNVQVRAPRGQADILSDLSGKCDIVFVDAPCTGTGTWRRNPDAKWRTRPGALEQRVKEQADILDKSCQYVKHGGALVYVTCSVLREENEDQITAFLQRNEDFTPLDSAHICRRAELPELGRFASQHGAGLRFSPYSAGTDGFYVCVLMRTRMEGREFW